MSSYVQTRMLGAMSPFVDSKKGDMANKTKCAGAHIKNNISTIAQEALVIGGTAAGAAYMAKSPTAARALQKVCRPVGDAVKLAYKSVKDTKMFAKVADYARKFKNLPGLNKGAAIVVAGLGLLGLSIVGGKHIYKQGQIDQKYTDKAEMQKYQEEVFA